MMSEAYCPACHTRLDEADDIGAFCPNPDCRIIDDIYGKAKIAMPVLASQERLTGCAIMWAGVIWTVPAPGRHHNVIHKICTESQRDCVPGEDEASQGFITNRNRFVDRREGLLIAMAAGQILRRTGAADDQLYSEDVW